MNHLKLAAFLFVFTILCLPSFAGTLQGGEKIFIPPLENGLDQFITAEMIKQKVPVAITQDEKQSQYILTGKSVDKGNNTKWFDVLLGTAGTRDSVQASISLVKKSDKTIVWANSAGDRSVWWGMLKRGGERKVAIRLVRSFKKDLFRK